MNFYALKTGIVLGAISVIVSFTLYLVNPELLGIMWLPFLFTVIYFVILIYTAVKQRNRSCIFLSFGKAWVYSMIALTVMGAISTLYAIALHHFDKGLSELLINQNIENMETLFTKIGVPEDILDDTLTKTTEDLKHQYTTAGLTKEYFFNWFFYALISLISGAFIKKKEDLKIE